MPTISGASKIKVVFILGATGTGKSKLAIALGKSFNVTNRVSESELSAAPHHLLAFLPSDAEFHATDFIHHCVDSISSIACRNHLPIVAGGSNSYIKALLEDPDFCAGHESCFILLDAHPSILNRFVSARVDCMMQKGLVEEARSLFDPENNDYNKGVKKAIGVPELDEYFRAEIAGSSKKEELERMLNEAVNNIKANTCKLIQSQVQKIWQLKNLDRWHIHRVDVFGIKIGWKSESCGGK
ncbi:Adenylate isopentenyltransferase [Rhynchospora pubera]|uniref:adenylate dimethylallyltransferase (ADP/ATP-dependent) n=1 Tax=Rhynchospora pubera TaxID=906938 RepID=A0AAV8EMS2_9POAL|nr:Adenylate isopentenyltransferase [Rhynchospora pubera]